MNLIKQDNLAVIVVVVICVVALLVIMFVAVCHYHMFWHPHAKPPVKRGHDVNSESLPDHHPKHDHMAPSTADEKEVELEAKGGADWDMAHDGDWNNAGGCMKFL